MPVMHPTDGCRRHVQSADDLLSVAHRMERERQVIDALANGAATLDALVTAIYPSLADALRGAATETVLAHLRKLEDEQRTLEQDGAWSLR